MNLVYIKIIPHQISDARSGDYGALGRTAQLSSIYLLVLFLLYSALHCHGAYNSEFYQDFTASFIRRSVPQMPQRRGWEKKYWEVLVPWEHICAAVPLHCTRKWGSVVIPITAQPTVAGLGNFCLWIGCTRSDSPH